MPFTVLIVDVKMLELDGIDLLRALEKENC
jgi:FixJ family two-component response regulator